MLEIEGERRSTHTPGEKRREGGGLTGGTKAGGKGEKVTQD